MIVALHGIEFFAYHGFYPEEQKLGNNFIVDIEVSFELQADVNDDDLQNTVNYEKLYKIACEQMKITRKLIETVAQGIIDDVKQQYAFIDSVTVSIKKISPLIGSKVKYSEVVINYSKP